MHVYGSDGIGLGNVPTPDIFTDSGTSSRPYKSVT